MLRFIPTFFTLVRIALIPFVVQTISTGQWGKASLFFIFAAVTDALDGWLARILSQTSLVGAVLDPLADKALVLSCLYAFSSLSMFVGEGMVGLLVPRWLFWMALAKEVLIVGGMTVLLVGYKVPVKPLIWGKLAMAVQVLYVVWVFLCYGLSHSPWAVEWYGMTGLVVTTTLLALVGYGLYGRWMFHHYHGEQ